VFAISARTQDSIASVVTFSFHSGDGFG